MSDIIVTIEQGSLKGKEENTCYGITYYSFKGIPYAKAPLGKLRFRSPQPPESWKGIRDATEHGNQCIQAELFPIHTGKITGSSDCLYLNVYAPEDPRETNGKVKPVMVRIHGGAFIFGSGDADYSGPDYLMSENVILVTFNYRLGALGFLRVDDPKVGIPGNAGLRDMVMALKWVQKNIIKFGGDPNNVTIFGASAGSAGVHFLTLSPLAKGLFHQAIGQGGTALCPWALIQPETKPLQKLAQVLKKEDMEESKFVEYLENLTDKELIEAQLKFKFILSKPFIFSPTIERKSLEPAVIPDDPLTIIRSGKVSKIPTIFGYTSREGMLLQLELEDNFKNFEDFVPYNLNIRKGSPESLEIAEKIKNFYFSGEEYSVQDFDIIYQILSDVYFENATNMALRELCKVNPENVYAYRFSFEESNNEFKKLAKIKESGASHGADSNYILKTSLTPFKPNSKECRTSERIVKLWTNFAKYGNPNPREKSDLIPIEWKPMKSDEFNYLEFGENLTVGVNPDWQRFQFWDNIFESLNVST